MRFLVDAQLSPRLAEWLRAKGHDADHVAIALQPTAQDNEIVASAVGAVIVTKDGDFVSLVEGRQDAPQLLWIRCGNTRNVAMFALLEDNWTRIEQELRSGQAIIELGQR